MFEGDWYYEVTLREGHTRVGWAQSLADIHAPVGYDEYGYGFGDVTGNVFHTGRPMKYANPWQIGDVIGCRIVLPEISASKSDTPSLMGTLQEKHEKFYPPLKMGKYKIKMTLHPGSFISFYKNGQSLGKSFGPLYKGKYHPCFSVYKGTLDVCFGPDFQYFSSVDNAMDEDAQQTRPCHDMSHVAETFDYGVHFTPSAAPIMLTVKAETATTNENNNTSMFENPINTFDDSSNALDPITVADERDVIVSVVD